MTDELPESDRIPGHPHPSETARLVGQEAAERAFLDAWRGGRLHHAWLLRGPQGIGKATLAYRIARALIAAPPEETSDSLFGALPSASPVPDTLDAPDGCDVLARIRAGAEPRLAVLRRGVNDKGRLYTQIRIDEVRAVKRFLGLSAADGGWRAVIVDPAEEMNTAAQNAILKILEEPPPRTVMLLVSHAPGRLLPTIRSRCRTLDLTPLSPEGLSEALAGAGAEVAAKDSAALAELAGGSVGAALRLVAEDGLALYRQLVETLTPSGVDRPRMVALAEAAAGRDAEERYRLALDLTLMLIGRLARHGAGCPAAAEAAPGEAALAARIAARPRQAALWAETAARVAAHAAHARAVNLDPAQTIMDTFLDLDATLARARQAA